MADTTATPPRSRAQRLDTIVHKVAPKAHAYMAAHGKWPALGKHHMGTSPDDSIAARVKHILGKTPDLDTKDATTVSAKADDAGRGAPYVFETLEDGSRRLKVTDDDGGTIAGSGPTIEDAIAALEAKLS